MAEETANAILLWLAAYGLHSTLFLGAAWLIERLWRQANPAFIGALWRTAMLAGILTASVQALGLVEPPAGRIAIDIEAVAPNPNIVPPLAPVQSHPAIAPVKPEFAPQNAPQGAASSAPLSLEPRGLILAPPAGLDWRHGLLALWGAISFLVAMRALFAWAAAHRELRGRMPVVQGPLFERIQVIAHEVGLKRLPQVSLSPLIAGPFTLPSGEICIPTWAHERLPQEQLDAMLAHEMAHTLHRDSLWLAIGMGVDTLFFFQPLNRLARKRIAHLAELCADDWAATRSGDGRPLAECLSTFVGMAHDKARAAATPEFAAAMAKPRSQIVQRVERLIGGRYSNGVVTMKSKLLIGACAIALAAAIPGLSITTAEAEPQTQRHVRVGNSGDMDITVVTNKVGYSLNVTGRGEIVLDPDGSGVSRLSNGGHLDATLTRNGQPRRVRYSGEQGGVKREFWVGSQSRAWNAEADQFVAELMPILFRETGLGANERADWLLKNRGPDALLSEIEQIESDSIQSRYALRYAETAAIPDPQFEKLLSIVSSQMSSDSQLRHALSKLNETQKPSGQKLIRLIRAGSTIDSDSETRALLGGVAATTPAGDDFVSAYLDVAGSIESDSELRAALKRLLSASTLTDEQVARTFDVAGQKIDSDFELSTLLRDNAQRVGSADMLAKRYANAAASIDSDSEHSAALRALADKAQLTQVGWLVLLQAVNGIGSDSQMSGMLAHVAPRLPRQQPVIDAYRAAMQHISSDSEYRRADRALNP